MNKKSLYFVLVILCAAVIWYLWKSDMIGTDSEIEPNTQTFVGDGYTLQYPDGWSFFLNGSDNPVTFSDCTNEYFEQYSGQMDDSLPNDACLLISVSKGHEGLLAYFSDTPPAREYEIVTESIVGGDEVRKIFTPYKKSNLSETLNDHTMYLIKNKNNEVLVLGNSDGFGRADSNEHQAKEAEIMEAMVSTLVFSE